MTLLALFCDALVIACAVAIGIALAWFLARLANALLDRLGI